MKRNTACRTFQELQYTFFGISRGEALIHHVCALSSKLITWFFPQSCIVNKVQIKLSSLRLSESSSLCRYLNLSLRAQLKKISSNLRTQAQLWAALQHSLKYFSKKWIQLALLKIFISFIGYDKPTKDKERKCGLFALHAQSVLPIKSGMNWALEKNVMVIGHGQYTFFRSIRRFCFQQHIQYWTSSQVGAKRGAFRAVSLQGSLGVKLMAFWRRVHWVVWVLYAST